MRRPLQELAGVAFLLWRSMISISIQEFSERVSNKVIRTESGCWEWTASKTASGYGSFTFKGRTYPAHRFVYQVMKGPVDKGMHLHHKCENRLCVFPRHLEPLTPKEHSLVSPNAPAYKKRNQTHCIHGHEFTPANTYVRKDGRRNCKSCLAAQKPQASERYRRFVDVLVMLRARVGIRVK